MKKSEFSILLPLKSGTIVDVDRKLLVSLFVSSCCFIICDTYHQSCTFSPPEICYCQLFVNISLQ